MSAMKVISIEANELNFHLVEKYVEAGHLPNFKSALKKGDLFTTRAEDKFEHLEPWIQWPSVYTGMSFCEHGVFRLGDIVHSNAEQIFEMAEAHTGRPVVAISPMNAVNRLQNPESVFVPDPWTNTNPSGGWDVDLIARQVKRLVNENAHGFRVSLIQIVQLSAAFSRNISFSFVPLLFSLLIKCINKPWLRPMVLDALLVMLCVSKAKKVKSDFASVFLNGCAHLQHHYYFSSKVYKGDQSNPAWFIRADADPILDGYEVYDRLLGIVLRLFPKHHVYVTTALSQIPNPVPVNYYRPRNHLAVLEKLGFDVSDVEVEPRMSRDFLLSFSSTVNAECFGDLLDKVMIGGDKKLFSVDRRGNSLFCKVSYFGEPSPSLTVTCGARVVQFNEHFSHVTIENGVHQSKGYFLSLNHEGRLSDQNLQSSIRIWDLRDLLLNSLGIGQQHDLIESR